jgi:hypothetical protein
MITYGATMRWLASDGWAEVSVTGRSSRIEAIEEVWQVAIRSGYTEPRWWQIQRHIYEIDYKRIWLDVLRVTHPEIA